MSTSDFRPAYQRVLDDLHEQISGGLLRPGDSLPSEDELAQRYGVSRTSVRGAIRALRESGLVVVQRPRGTFVRVPPVRTVRAPSERYQWEKDRARLSLEDRQSTGSSERESGLDTEALEFSASYRRLPAPQRVADALDIKPNTEVLERCYETRSRESNSLVNRSHSYLPITLIESNPDLLDDSNEPWPGGTQHQLSTVGVEIDKITDSIATRMPTVEEKALMDLVDGTPVFEIEKLSTSTTGEQVELALVVLPGDRAELQYTINLAPWE